MLLGVIGIVFCIWILWTNGTAMGAAEWIVVLLTSSWQQFDDLIYYNISPRYSPGYVIILLFLFLEYQRFSLSLHAACDDRNRHDD